MRKKYLLYVSVLVCLFLFALIIWPDRTINLDIGSFHYHKIWKGPNLEEITSERIKNDLNLDLGSDFRGGTSYEYRVVFPETAQDKKTMVDNVVDEIRERLYIGHFYQSEIYWEKRGEDYYVLARVENLSEGQDDYTKESLFHKGVLQLWGESDQTDIAAQATDESANSFESFLDQNYDKIAVDANDIKGYRVLSNEDGYSIKLALSDVQAETLTSSIFSFYGKNLLAILDEQFIVIDGSDLGEQYQTTGKIKTISLTGFQTKSDARLLAGVIANGPLELELEQIKDEAYPASYGKEVIGKIALAFLAILIVFGLILVALFKIDGVVGALASALWGILVAVGLKILPIALTVPLILTLGFLTGLFIWKLFLVIRSIDQKNKAREETDFIMYFKDAATHRKISIIIYMMMIFGVISLIAAIWPGTNIAHIVLLVAFINWFIIEQCISAIYKFAAFLKEKDE